MTDWHSFSRYLTAKRTVDDRALNRQVWHTLRENLPRRNRLRVLEIGGGIGTMVERIADWGLTESATEYTASPNLNCWVIARAKIKPQRRRETEKNKV